MLVGRIAQCIDDAEGKGYEEFVLVSHNFELLKAGSAEPDRLMVRRFEGLCNFLQARSSRMQVSPPMRQATALGMAAGGRASVPLHATARRYAEQAVRRFA